MDVPQVYQDLMAQFGTQGWWPICISQKSKVKSPKSLRIEYGLTYGVPYRQLEQYQTSFRDPYFEIAIGAILTQNTAWRNVAVAIENLYRAKALTPQRLLTIHPMRLQKLIRPTGYYRQKTKKLRGFSRWLLDQCHGDIERLKRLPLPASRRQLLQLWGIGPETADSILLYALNKPIFVVDEYTRRLCRQHGVLFDEYNKYRKYFEKELQKITKNYAKLAGLYQEYHALIVAFKPKQDICL